MTKTKTKPELTGMSLDDFIAQSAPKKVGKRKPKGKKKMSDPSNFDCSKYTDDQIRAELDKRGMSNKGSRAKLENRLRHCVRQAWEKYNKSLRKGISQNPQKKSKKNKKKSTLTAEQKEEITKQNEANRLAKAKRKAENKRKAEEARAEARERKRLKTEANNKKQSLQRADQKKLKQARQKLEAYAHFDMKGFAEQLKKKIDPRGNKISSLNYDFSKKGFLIKFKDAKHVDAATKGSTISKLTTYKLNSTCSILPAPLEANCAFFLSPTAVNHPDAAAAKAWLDGQGAGDKPELEKLQLWIDDAVTSFSHCGKIINVFRERNFMVVHFSSSSAAKKFMSEAKDSDFNGVKFVWVMDGTPTKKDRMDCEAANPIPKKPKKKTKKE